MNRLFAFFASLLPTRAQVEPRCNLETLRITTENGIAEISRNMACGFQYAQVSGRDFKLVAENQHGYTRFSGHIHLDRDGMELDLVLPTRDSKQEAMDDITASAKAIVEFAGGGTPVVVIKDDFSTTFEQAA